MRTLGFGGSAGFRTCALSSAAANTLAAAVPSEAPSPWCIAFQGILPLPKLLNFKLSVYEFVWVDNQPEIHAHDSV